MIPSAFADAVESLKQIPVIAEDLAATEEAFLETKGNP